MSLHSYSSVVMRIDKRGGPLAKYLSAPMKSMELRHMNRPADVSLAIQCDVEQLAARTARCVHAFSNPVVARSQQRANGERLRWVQTYSLREFKYCVALQDAAAKFVAEGGVNSLRRNAVEDGGPDPSPAAVWGSSGKSASTITRSGVSAPCEHGSTLPAEGRTDSTCSPSACYLRNTDDRSYVDASTAAPGVTVAAPAATDASAAAVSSFVGSDAPSGSPPCSRRLTRAQAELGLERGDIDVLDLPFDLALEMLRPQESMLDVLVNEAPLQSDHLNSWFSRFCRRRVAWRVLHEHLLHLTRPDLNAPVVWDDTDVLSILQGAANTVVDIYAKLGVSDQELVIHLVENAAVLTSHPEAAYVSSSVDCQTRAITTYASGAAVALPEPPVSATVYSVEGHLAYVFREVLKNACVATLRWTSDVSVTVHFASDDRWVVVDIIDHAGGISLEHMRNIWKFGWTTSDHYESHLGGFGVGLPISKVYMDMWGGAVDVFSTVGGGTTVRVRYPRSATEVLVPDVPVDASEGTGS